MGLFMAASIGWGLLFLTDSLEMWHAVVLLVLHGCAGATWGPSAQLLIHHLVDAPSLPSAVRLIATARWLGLMLGPAVGGPILLMLGPTYGILVNALIYLPLVLWLRKRLTTKRHPAPAGFGARAAARGDGTACCCHDPAAGCARCCGQGPTPPRCPISRGTSATRMRTSLSMLFAAMPSGAVAGADPGKPRPAVPRPQTLAGCDPWGMRSARSPAQRPSLALLLSPRVFLELPFYAMAQTLCSSTRPTQLRGPRVGSSSCSHGVRDLLA